MFGVDWTAFDKFRREIDPLQGLSAFSGGLTSRKGICDLPRKPEHTNTDVQHVWFSRDHHVGRGVRKFRFEVSILRAKLLSAHTTSFCVDVVLCE